jgi:hypothetical protein
MKNMGLELGMQKGQLYLLFQEDGAYSSIDKDWKRRSVEFQSHHEYKEFRLASESYNEVSGSVTMTPDAFSDLILSPGSPMYSGFSFSFTEYNM